MPWAEEQAHVGTGLGHDDLRRGRGDPRIEVSKVIWGSKGTSRAQVTALSVAMEASKKSRWSITCRQRMAW